MKNRIRNLFFIGLLITFVYPIIGFPGCQKYLQPLPDSVQLELDNALEHGFDGIIIYVNRSGKSSFYSAGWNKRKHPVPADPHALFK